MTERQQDGSESEEGEGSPGETPGAELLTQGLWALLTSPMHC